MEEKKKQSSPRITTTTIKYNHVNIHKYVKIKPKTKNRFSVLKAKKKKEIKDCESVKGEMHGNCGRFYKITTKTIQTYFLNQTITHLKKKIKRKTRL